MHLRRFPIKRNDNKSIEQIITIFVHLEKISLHLNHKILTQRRYPFDYPMNINAKIYTNSERGKAECIMFRIYCHRASWGSAVRLRPEIALKESL